MALTKGAAAGEVRHRPRRADRIKIITDLCNRALCEMQYQGIDLRHDGFLDNC